MTDLNKLAEENRRAQDKKVIDAFVKELEALQDKHGCDIILKIDYTPQAILPGMAIKVREAKWCLPSV